LVDEKELPADYFPPEGVQIIRPFKGLEQFFPNTQPGNMKVLEVVEQQFLVPFGSEVAKIFSVELIDDLEYDSIAEEDKAAWLSVVLTRSGVRQVGTSLYEWDPIVVVVKYTKYVYIRCQFDVSSMKLDVKHMMLWNNKAQEYAPIHDEVAGFVNPEILLVILKRYAEYEGLVVKQVPTPNIIVP
jgi:hypothetical protein